MPEDTQGVTTPPEQGQPSGDASAGSENTGNMIPKARFDEVNRRAKEAERLAQELNQRLEQLEQTRLAESGNYQELAKREAERAKGLEPFKARAEALETLIRSQNEERIGQIPESMRPLIEPLRASLPPEQLAAYLNSNWQYLQGRQAPNLDAGVSGGGQSVTVTEADRQQAAAASAMGYKVTPEQIAARRLKR